MAVDVITISQKRKPPGTPVDQAKDIKPQPTTNSSMSKPSLSLRLEPLQSNLRLQHGFQP